jgi:predicted NUDIX family NTP pyrophosphohydrolase
MAPVIGIAGAWGVAKRSKNRKEKEVKAATALCLSELGYTVEGWKVAKDQERIKLPKAKKAATP